MLFGDFSVVDAYFAPVVMRLFTDALRITFAARAPERLSHDPNGYQCKCCDHREICHGDGRPERTCRGCEHVKPAEGGWRCQAHDEPLSSAAQREGCGVYQLAHGFAQQVAFEH